ncbi:MAG TPA: hypothetical protein VNJ70_18635 [Thermoanaerobaculia bacterium]|nr:hypothetical protein [Thermoanaerobaculia bacterium]
MLSTRGTLTFCCLLVFAALPLAAQPLPCRPCAGLRVETALAGEALEALAGALPAGADATVVLAWEAPLDGSADPAPLARAAALAPPPPATPPAPPAPAPRLILWLTLPFRTPPPLAQQAVRLQGELDALSRLAAAAPPGTFFQIAWRPEGVDPAAPLDFTEYAFLLKRAAVAVTGARPDGRVVTQSLRAGAEAVEALYAQEVAAYLEAVAVLPGRPEAVTATAEAVERLDPGRLVVVDAPPLPDDPQTLPAEAARWAVRGASLVLFRVEREQPGPAEGSGGAPEASPAPPEASAPAPEASAPPPEASGPAREASAPPREASASPPEASASPPEASAPAPEASVPPREASPAPPEASAPPPEASAPPQEASPPAPEASAPPPEASAAPGEPPSLPESFFQALTPLSVLAREFAGDLAYDPTSSPQGSGEAWAFVRGEDLALRVIAVTPAAPQVDLRFPDPLLGSPVIVDAPTGRTVEAAGNRVGGAYVVRLYQPRPVTLLRLERVEQVELEAVKERVTVAGEREVPVEEILRRLQAFEDAQARRLLNYRAVNTTHLRFQVGASSQSFEATLQGPFFWTPESGADWVWQDLFVNGVRWRAKTIPEIPLVQPEKAAAMPLEIHFTRQYRYRLRGSEKIDGRDAWVVDFAPTALETGEGGKLYQGTVWVDKQLSSRLRTRAVQVGLEGEVISNEETLHYTPIDAEGRAAPWGAAGSFVLPLRILAQQILSVVNAATVVERETNLTEVRVNDPGFEQARQAAAESDLTMVRDTPQGLRYLVKDEATGERVVKEGFDSNKLFLLGGVFYDDALDFPLPLAGINYFSFDFRGTGQQLNAFFGGALLTVDVAQPRLFGSRFDAGADFFALAVPLADTVWRNDDEVHEEEVETRSGNVGFKLGRPLGNFVKVSSEYTLAHHDYGTTDNTIAGFVPPGNHLTHSLQLNGRFARAGWRVGLEGSLHRRSEWEPWGLPGNPDYFAEAQDYSLWGATLSKNWYLPYFQKIGAEVNYLGGSDLDRFSKYEFGFFGASRVHGYQSDRVRATEVTAGHLSYGFEIGEAFRLEAVADAALATDEDAGLDQELLAGIGVNGTFLGPWQTVVNLDVGVPVQGPDDGFVLYVVFLKLFR